MKKFLSFAIVFLMLFNIPAHADEGMWLLAILGKKYEDMKKLGLKLTPEDIYSVNHSSLKDAVVNFGNFCSGEIVSDKGLLLTNHHCGYERIQSHSTVENDYLKNGFWAKSFKEELPNPGLTVTFLIRMEDVTNELINVPEDQLEARETDIQKKAVEGTSYTAEIKSFFEGNQFFLFVYETYNDVRLVGAPPSSIGKFGGDTDNWMWPRHTGDFSVFRVYTGSDGKPAEYSENNIPLSPKHFFPVSLKGVKEGDFTMIMGYPGSTKRYLPSDGIKLAYYQTNPARIKLRAKRMEVMKSFMDKSEKISLMYSPKYYEISNYYKYFIGENLGIEKLNVIEEKKQEEKAFMQWVDSSAERKNEYTGIFSSYDTIYQHYAKVNLPYTYLQEGVFGIGIMNFSYQFATLYAALKAGLTKEQLNPVLEDLTKKVEEHFTDYYQPIDKKIFSEIFRMYHDDIDSKFYPPFFKTVDKKYKGSFAKYAAYVFRKTILADSAKTMAFLEDPDLKTLEEDPAFSAMLSVLSSFRKTAGADLQSVFNSLGEVDRTYLKGLLEKSDTLLYPDANFTERLTYGTCRGYWGKDAVYYKYYTTLKGVIEKEDSTSDEFYVEPKLKALYYAHDFGPYANDKGEMPICFITDNDITGGNSGSPVINAEGQLIGLAFDGNWEAMSGDFEFSPKLQRTIATDIRYVLFIMDKYAHADRLLKEMNIILPEKANALEEKATSDTVDKNN